MQLTQKDYDERKQRVDAGDGDDEDARLVKHYEAEGFEPSKHAVAEQPKADDEAEAAKAPRPGRGRS